MIGNPNTSFQNQNNNYYRVLHGESFDDKGYTNNISLTQARMTNPDSLNPVITHLMGKESKKFPLLFLTEGQLGGVQYKEIEDVEYDWPVFGRLRTTDQVVKHNYQTGDKPGYGGVPVIVTFKTQWFKNQHNVTSPNGVVCRVLSKTKVSEGFEYSLDIVRRNNEAYVPLSELTAGTAWSMSGGANVAESYSFGNESNKQMPGKLKNQIGILRKSYEIGGNVSNRTVTFQFSEGGKTTNYYLPFEEWQHEIQFKQAIEESLWDSQYNRNENGQIMNFDPDTQLPIPYGAGLIQQIPNVDTYGILTTNKLQQVIGDIMFGATDTDNMNITLFTGTGGKREFSNTLLKDAASWSVYDGSLNKTITGSPTNLVYGAYFTQFRHVDGHMITIKDLPILDHGGRAQNAPRHPITGLPMTSYEMHFVDMTNYEGQNNVQLVSQKGRSLIRGIEQGMTLIKGLNYGDYKGNSMDIKLSTSQDKSAIHYLKTCGVALRRNTHCFSFYCNLS
jgi:hypothetical protein